MFKCNECDDERKEKFENDFRLEKQFFKKCYILHVCTNTVQVVLTINF